MKEKTIFSGIQPSGILTLGNYLGALKNWALLQKSYECYYCVVDMHAITIRQDAADLRRRCMQTMALFLASGLSPEHNTLFFQSHVSAHAELTWVLSCYAYMGELSRMTQYKDKSARQGENINAGLFTYPVLMAADILLYQSDLVPIGDDQKQHLELARDIAERFNNLYGDVFVVPEPYIPKVGARVMSLQDPLKKMSKSDENINGFISMLDPPDVVVRKFKRAVTDSDNRISFDEGSAGVVNLLSVYAACTGKSKEQTLTDFEGKGYGALKSDVADAVVAVLEPLQKEYARILKDKGYLEALASKGAEKASEKANRTLMKVYRKVGFAPGRLG